MAKEWESEPDRLEWDHAGLKCAIRRGPMGHLCGYVGVPEGHVLHGVSYSSPSSALAEALKAMGSKPAPDRFPVHLGLLAGKLEASPEVVLDVHGGLTYSDNHVPLDKPDGAWWFGFDCAHAGDLSPGMLKHTGVRFGEVYRNLAYVKTETERLAEQLASLQA